MRIGLYGMPSSGKTSILDKIDFMEVIVGSKLLRSYDPLFDTRDEKGREKARRDVALQMMKKETFIMDGHYAFGDEIAFTEEEGKMYDVYIYLYVDPIVLKKRMTSSQKNNKYAFYDLKEWQDKEIDGLRNYCHKHNKDFYVIDNPPTNDNLDIEIAIKFIKEILNGFSCYTFAEKIANEILHISTSNTISLFDGDKTITVQDTSNTVFNYKTQIYDNNFYTGFHSWMQYQDFKNIHFDELKNNPVEMNTMILKKINKNSFILTSGHEKIWKFISKEINTPFFCGVEMSAETKLYITKILQKHGKYVIGYGDGMNDYYMLKQADKGYLVTKKDGTISKSLCKQNLEGIIIDRIK